MVRFCWYELNFLSSIEGSEYPNGQTFSIWETKELAEKELENLILDPIFFKEDMFSITQVDIISEDNGEICKNPNHNWKTVKEIRENLK